MIRRGDIVENHNIYFVDAVEEDIELIIQMENHRDNKDYLWTSTRKEHMQHIESDNFRLGMIKKIEDDSIIGYYMLQLDWESDVCLLRRIAITEKGKGFGKKSMILLFEYAFNDLNMNRFWLDVYPDHKVGINLYEGLGMKKEGVLRQIYKDPERGYLDQVLYSILKDEYERIEY